MPDISKARVQEGGSYTLLGTTGGTDREPFVPSVDPIILSVAGSNVGRGSRLLLGTDGNEETTVFFRKIRPSFNTVIVDDDDTVAIRAEVRPTKFIVDLLDVTDELVVRSIPLGIDSGSELLLSFDAIQSEPAGILRAGDNSFFWERQTNSNVTLVAAVVEPGLTMTGAPINVAGTFGIGLQRSGIAGTFVAATFALRSSGFLTGALSNDLGEFNEGASLGSEGSPVYLRKTGRELVFRSLGHPDDPILIIEQNNSIITNLPSIIAPGLYSIPTTTITDLGYVTEAMSRGIIGSGIVSVTDSAGSLVISSGPMQYQIAKDGLPLFVNATRLSFRGPDISVVARPGAVADITFSQSGLVDVANVGGGTEIEDVANGTIRVRSLLGSGRFTVTSGADTITIATPPPGPRIYAFGNEGPFAQRNASLGFLQFEIADASLTNVTVAGRARVQIRPNLPVLGATNVGSSISVSPLRSMAASVVNFSAVRADNTTMRSSLSPSHVVLERVGMIVGTVQNVQMMAVAGDVVATSTLAGAVSLDLLMPTYSLTTMQVLPGITATYIVPPASVGTYQIKQIVSGLLAITEGVNEIIVAQSRSLSGTAVSYDATQNVYAVSGPTVAIFNAFDGAGNTIPIPTISDFYDVATPTFGGSALYMKKWVGFNGVVVRQGPTIAGTLGITSDLLIDGQAYLNASGTLMTEGTYAVARLSVDTLGRVTSIVPSGGIVYQVNEGGPGVPGTIAPFVAQSSFDIGGTLEFRPISTSGAIQPQATIISGVTYVGLGLASIVAATYGDVLTLSVDNGGRLMSIQYRPSVTPASTPNVISVTAVRRQRADFLFASSNRSMSALFENLTSTGGTAWRGEGIQIPKTVDANPAAIFYIDSATISGQVVRSMRGVVRTFETDRASTPFFSDYIALQSDASVADLAAATIFSNRVTFWTDETFTNGAHLTLSLIY